ncbi:hypothetical protein ACOI1H_13345 [Loktanella sp. DJP18]|uniref:hypothetical protein n=1 Tax=Loktanella sp. DJP18 TaxID=3409788 RepID=UPI003BB78F2E
MAETPIGGPLNGLPGCLFARPGTSPRTVFGKATDGTLWHISEVKRGDDALICPDCGGILVARLRDELRVAHFAHKAMAECRSAGETALHRLAKEIIQEGGAILLPAYCVAGQVSGVGRTVTAQPQQRVSFDRVDIEVPQPGFKPDLIGSALGRDGEVLHRLIIEIRVTHAVDAEKLSKLRVHGESVIEIDLSGLDRGLTGSELAAQILEAAPRSWLYHRNEDALTDRGHRQMAQEEASKERKKTAAIEIQAHQKKCRADARLRQPSRGNLDQEEWARQERTKWSFLEMEGIYTVGADDGIFDVAPDVWRSFIVSVLAPWREKPHRLDANQDLARLSQFLAGQLRERKWVKPEFDASIREFRQRRYANRDIVSEAIQLFLMEGLTPYGFGGYLHQPGVDLNAAAWAIQKAWKDGTLWASTMARLVRLLQGKGGNVTVLGVEMPHDLTPFNVIAAARDHGAGYTHVLNDLISEVVIGEARHGPRHDINAYISEGIDITMPGDLTPRSGQRILDLIHAEHMANWQAQVDAIIECETDRLLSVFLDLSNRGVLPDDPDGAVADLLDADALRRIIATPIDPAGNKTLATAQRRIAMAVDRLTRLAKAIEGLADLQALCSDPDASRLVGEAGTIAVMRRFSEGRDPAMQDVSVTSARNALANLARLSSGWGYGDEFAGRAMSSIPYGDTNRLVDLMVDGDVIMFRRAMVEITSRREPPKWIKSRDEI